MVQKKPVSITRQTIYQFIPFLGYWAFYKVEKLRLAIVISIAFFLVGAGLGLSYYEPDPTVVIEDDGSYLVMQLILLVSESAVFIYLIRKWSNEWNNSLSSGSSAV